MIVGFKYGNFNMYTPTNMYLHFISITPFSDNRAKQSVHQISHHFHIEERALPTDNKAAVEVYLNLKFKFSHS